MVAQGPWVHPGVLGKRESLDQRVYLDKRDPLVLLDVPVTEVLQVHLVYQALQVVLAYREQLVLQDHLDLPDQKVQREILVRRGWLVQQVLLAQRVSWEARDLQELWGTKGKRETEVGRD